MAYYMVDNGSSADDYSLGHQLVGGSAIPKYMQLLLNHAKNTTEN